MQSKASPRTVFHVSYSLVASWRGGSRICDWKVGAALSSGNHAALEQFVRDRRRDFVDEGGAHLRIVSQHLQRLLLHLRLLPRRGLAFLLGQGLAGRGLVRLDDFLGDLLHDWERLLRTGNARMQ